MEAKRVVTALLVDDDPASRKRNEESLKDRGYLVIVASDAGSALDVAKRSSPGYVGQSILGFCRTTASLPPAPRG